MPKFYCEYCDVYLAHESVGVRRQHKKGRKHKDNVRAYYLSYVEKHPEVIAEISIATGIKVPPVPGLPGVGINLPPLGLPPMIGMPPMMPGMMPPMMPGMPGMPPGMPPMPGMHGFPPGMPPGMPPFGKGFGPMRGPPFHMHHHHHHHHHQHHHAPYPQR
nr:U1 small nuclear ribonucleoprotein C [Euglena gracilis]